MRAWKSTLEVKLARPMIRMQAQRSPAHTNNLADGVLMRLPPTICTSVCCTTSDSSRLARDEPEVALE